MPSNIFTILICFANAIVADGDYAEWDDEMSVVEEEKNYDSTRLCLSRFLNQ